MGYPLQKFSTPYYTYILELRGENFQVDLHCNAPFNKTNYFSWHKPKSREKFNKVRPRYYAVVINITEGTLSSRNYVDIE